MKPKHPIYVVSKGRWDTRLTIKALENMGVDFWVVVEASQYDNYAAVVDKSKLLTLPQQYLIDYDTYDDLGLTKSTGPGPARNFAWDHSIEQGAERHWVMDDNIDGFYRLHNNLKILVTTGAFFRAQEDFTDRYTNVAMAGPDYDFFAPRKKKLPPFICNTRIYSCNLIKNDLPYRWRGRYNEDTDLSLRILKDGWVTVQFYAFLQGKVATQTIHGGNTAEFYAKEGTLPKSEMLKRMHPDVTRLVWKYNRYHHHVDYRPFKGNKLIKKDIEIPQVVNNYSMQLRQRVKNG